MIQMKRAYELATRKDGYRVLVDRLWPRGLKKSELAYDEWAKELAPSAELRRAFAHKPERWADFRSKYRVELRAKEASRKLAELTSRAERGTVTLIYAAKDEAHNNAVVLKQILEKRLAAMHKRKAA